MSSRERAVNARGGSTANAVQACDMQEEQMKGVKKEEEAQIMPAQAYLLNLKYALLRVVQ